MSPSVLLLCLLTFPILAHSDPQGHLFNCGGADEVTVGGLKYAPDDGFINVGKSAGVNGENLNPLLTTVRYFPDTNARKYCYSIPVNKGSKYLVRTIYYYGGFDGEKDKQPPVFAQIVDGTKWNIVNTTEDYAKGLSSYYEVMLLAAQEKLSVCLARNAQTGNSSPFISGLEVQSLDATLYNPTDFSKYALVTVARDNFGGGQNIISFPDDKFNRMWQPFKDLNPMVESHSNISGSDFWNLPPPKVFSSGITTSRGKKLEIQWPTVPLPATNYYIAFYFQDNRTPSRYSWRVFDVVVNNQIFYKKLNVSAKGVTVYAAQWPLSGQTKITMIPAEGSPVGPIVNAAELLLILPLGGHTMKGDAMAMEELARSIDNSPPDWRGDPCLPKENSWTGVSCSQGNDTRVISVNLTSAGLSGTLPPSIGNLTSLTNLWLGRNNISGTIPDMSALKALETLHLENNKLKGSIPESLGKLPKLREINLHNNKLDGKVPPPLKNRKGVKV